MWYPASLTNFSIISSKCDLGEGLFVNGLAAAWVDINKSKIFLYKNSLIEFDVKNRPSVIYQMSEDILIFGSENGICKIDLKNKTEELINDIEIIIRNIGFNDKTSKKLDLGSQLNSSNKEKELLNEKIKEFISDNIIIKKYPVNKHKYE